MDNRIIMQALPLVASVLGDKYGVTVHVGGREASTNGKVINLPSLPLDCDETLLGLARGYIDHESAHIRETDFKAIKEAKLTPLENHIMNSIEDWRVENKLAALFPGCRGNFNWLIKHFFTDDSKKLEDSLVHLVPNLILLTVRSWDVQEVENARQGLQDVFEKRYPSLCQKLDCILKEVRTNCSSTSDSIGSAKRISALLRTTSTSGLAAGKNSTKGSVQGQPDGPMAQAKNEDKRAKDLGDLLSVADNQLPQNIGEILSDKLSNDTGRNQKENSVQVAQVGVKSLTPFPQSEVDEIKRAESMLKVRLGRVMQAEKLTRGHLSRRGRVSSQSLAKIIVSDPKIFNRQQIQPGINTAVHLLLDTSGSMRTRIDLACKSCYAMAKALESIKGINVGVTVFPAARNNGISVCPLVEHGERVPSEFSTNVYGGTPLGATLWWVLQQLTLLNESRKIILVITDGAPDDRANVKDAIKTGKRLGVELYGVGIHSDSVKQLIPHGSCRVDDLTELAPAMYDLLSGALVNN